MTLAEKKHWDFACKFGPSATAEVSRGWLRTVSKKESTEVEIREQRVWLL